MALAEFSCPEPIEINEFYETAQDELTPLAAELMEKHPFDIGFLRSVNIRYLFALKPRKRQGRSILGSAKAYGHKDELLHGWQCEVVICKETWEVNPDYRSPLLFHELCHFIQEDGLIKLRNHDVEEFSSVVQHYGLWERDLKQFGDVVQGVVQKTIFDKFEDITAESKEA